MRPPALVLSAALLAACTQKDRGAPTTPPAEEPEVPRAAVELLVERYARSGQRSFYTMAPDGSRVAPFPGIPDDATEVAPAPDGRSLALLRPSSSGDVHIWRMDRDGANLRPLLEGERVVHSISWSPDGARLVFGQSTLYDADDLWIVNADGSGARNLTPDPSGIAVFDRTPVWSPDGTRIAFSSNRSGSTHLWVMDADGGNPRQVLPSGLVSEEREPAWSPDGSRLAFRSLADGPGIGVSAPDGSGYRTFAVNKRLASITWSPDGRVLFTNDITGDHDVYALDTASGEMTNLTRHRAYDVRVVKMRHVAPGAWRGLAAAERYRASAPGTPAVTVGDFVANGAPDLALLAPGASSVRLMRGLGGGRLEPLGELEAVSDLRALASADVSRDGADDLVVLGPDALHVYRGGAEGPGLATIHPLTGDGKGLAVGDLDGDGSTDIAAIHSRDGDVFKVAVHSASSFDGALVWILDYTASFAGAGHACAEDFTGEGYPDLAVLASGPGASVVLLPGQGDVSFAAPVVAARGLGDVARAAHACADLDGDRRADLALLRPEVAAGLSLHRSTGAALEGPTPIDARGTSLAAADLDRDGDTDLVVVGPASPSAAFLRNLGDGRLARPVEVAAGGAPLRVLAADLDGDRWPDLVVADEDGSVAVLRNLGAAPP